MKIIWLKTISPSTLILKCLISKYQVMVFLSYPATFSVEILYVYVSFKVNGINDL